MDNSITSIVGHRPHATLADWQHIDGWAPGFGPSYHRRSVDWYSFTGGQLMGLGIGLLIALVVIRRRNPDN